jgi:sec-independent protein translocase protein TatB
VGGAEIFFLIVLGVVIFGPEKLPDLARKAARIVHYLRGVANNARSTLSTELGPEFADLSITDLNPKTFVRKHLLDDGQVVVKEVSSVKGEVSGALVAGGAAAAILSAPGIPSDTSSPTGPAQASAPVPAPVRRIPPPPFDPEAT